MSEEILTVTQDFVTLDLLLWRRFRREVPDLVEKTLANNRELAEQGPILRVGTQVRVIIEDTVAPAAERITRLWG